MDTGWDIYRQELMGLFLDHGRVAAYARLFRVSTPVRDILLDELRIALAENKRLREENQKLFADAMYTSIMGMVAVSQMDAIDILLGRIDSSNNYRKGESSEKGKTQ